MIPPTQIRVTEFRRQELFAQAARARLIAEATRAAPSSARPKASDDRLVLWSAALSVLPRFFSFLVTRLGRSATATANA
jgi:hypothetical protein